MADLSLSSEGIPSVISDFDQSKGNWSWELPEGGKSMNIEQPLSIRRLRKTERLAQKLPNAVRGRMA
jgi:hypothetical protein